MTSSLMQATNHTKIGMDYCVKAHKYMGPDKLLEAFWQVYPQKIKFLYFLNFLDHIELINTPFHTTLTLYLWAFTQLTN